VNDNTSPQPIPEGIAKLLRRFASLPPDMTRQALVQYSNKLPPLPEHLQQLDTEHFKVHECQTPVAIFPEVVDGRMYFYADVPQGAPTIRALLAMLFEALNGQPPSVTISIPPDFVRQVMHNIGLGTREVGLNAMVERLKRAARQAQAEGGPDGGPASIGA
jgi:cysteine desulfuration protein SufE